MLMEKNVSAGSTWEKELSKIVFDKRYLLLSAVERKAVITMKYFFRLFVLRRMFVSSVNFYLKRLLMLLLFFVFF